MEALDFNNTAERIPKDGFPNAEKLLHLLVKGATEYALILLDPDGRIIYWNEGAHRIFGYEESEIRGKNILYLFTQEDVELKVAHQEIQKAADRGWADDERWHRRKDGTLFWANGVVTSLKDEHGKIIGFSKVLRDQTSRKRTEDRLKSLVAGLHEFTHTASHDLQEPLRTISTFLELIDRQCRGRISEEIDGYLDHALKGTRCLRTLLTDLLTYSASTEEKQKFEKTDVAAVVDMAVSNLEVLITENLATVNRTTLPIINALPGQLVQVFQNLIANSIKYRRTDEPPKVYIEGRHANKEWLFTVSDNGIGIPHEKRNEVFKAFRRLHSKNEIPGSGLGLSICKRIVERHEGRIWIESHEGQGTKVFFTIPAELGANGETFLQTNETDGIDLKSM